MFESVDGGSTWYPLNTNIPYEIVNVVKVSPQYLIDRTVFISTYQGGVYKSSDGGITWMDINSGLLPNLIRDIAVSPDYYYDQTIFVGTSQGVYRSLDSGTSWSRVQTLNRYEDNDDLMDFKGNWETALREKFSGAMIHYSNTGGDTLTFAFKGSFLRWIGYKGPNLGKADVYLDDALIGIVDLYSPNYRRFTPLVEIGGLPSDWHTLVIGVKGTKNDSSSNTYVTIDAIDVKD